MGDLGRAEVGGKRGPRCSPVLAGQASGALLAWASGAVLAWPASGGGHGDREAVIVAGDLHLPGGQVLDRLVHPAVAEAELVGAQAERPAQDLAAQADAEHRHAAGEHATDRVHRVAGRSRVARAV